MLPTFFKYVSKRNINDNVSGGSTLAIREEQLVDESKPLKISLVIIVFIFFSLGVTLISIKLSKKSSKVDSYNKINCTDINSVSLFIHNNFRKEVNSSKIENTYNVDTQNHLAKWAIHVSEMNYSSEKLLVIRNKGSNIYAENNDRMIRTFEEWNDNISVIVAWQVISKWFMQGCQSLNDITNNNEFSNNKPSIDENSINESLKTFNNGFGMGIKSQNSIITFNGDAVYFITWYRIINRGTILESGKSKNCHDIVEKVFESLQKKCQISRT